MKKSFFSIFLLIILLSIIFSAVPPKITKVINKAGSNRKELIKAIDYFKKAKDKQKLKAIYFLIENMEDKSYVIYSVVDKNGNKLDFNPLSFKTYKEMSDEWFRLVKEKGAHHIRAKELKDIKTIKADFLIENVELAFKAWKENPWSDSYTFKEFLEYILPYRGSNEPLENWRRYFFNKFSNLKTKLKNKKDPVEATIYINSSLMSWFKFDDRYYEHPTDQGLKEMLKSKKGRCEDMTNLAIYALRANGIAVVSDFTPFWAVSNNNHAWNAVINRKKEVIPFMGGLTNPYKYRITDRVAKVYRKTFSLNHNSLPFKTEESKIPNRYLKVKSMVDVTSSYTSVSTLKIKLNREIKDKFLYLTVFNTGNWEAVGYGEVEGNEAVFKNVGNKDIIYLIMKFNGKKLIPVKYPFILKPSGKILSLKPDNERKRNVLIAMITKRTIKEATVESKRAKIGTGVEKYELFFWNNGWEKVGKPEITSKGLLFRNVPENSLLWLTKKGGKKEERIFIYKAGKQIFY